MGGAGAAIVSNNPFAPMLNPAQLGFSSLRGDVSVGFVPSLAISPYYSSTYSPAWYLTNMSSAFAVNFKLPLNRFWHGLPFAVSVGAGYSDIKYVFGFNSNGAPYVGSRTDYLNDITLGLGVKYIARLAMGFTIAPVTDKYYVSPGSFTASTTTHSIGAILQIPILLLASKIAHAPVPAVSDLSPVFNITVGYSARNLGTHQYYEEPGLPGEADLGWNIELGLKTRVDGHKWRWVSFTFLREADASLFSLDSTMASVPLRIRFPNSNYNYYYTYKKGLGGFHLYDNLIAGKPTAFENFVYGETAGNIGIRKGAQLELGQFIYLREGSVTEAGLPTYTTYGWGLRLNGLVKTLLFIHLLNQNNGMTELLLDHFNLEFDYSKATGGPFQGEPFENLSLVVR